MKKIISLFCALVSLALAAPTTPINNAVLQGTTSVGASATNAGTITAPSTGAVTVAANGTNQNVTITPSDSGAQGAVSSRAMLSSQSIIGTGGWEVYKEAVSATVFPSIEIQGYQNGFGAESYYVFAKAGGTLASPTTASANSSVGGITGRARANGAWRNVFSLNAATATGFSDSDYSSVFSLTLMSGTSGLNIINGAGGDTNALGRKLTFGGNTLTAFGSHFLFDLAQNSQQAAWGVEGAMLNVRSRTITDTTSSGTVATAAAVSFKQPTFAASSATTFTDFANVYIANAPARGTNVTLGNPWALWVDAGDVRLDGNLNYNVGGVMIVSTDTLSGAGAVSVTKDTTKLTSSGVAQAITLANGTDGQIKRIIHDVDGGSMVLTPTTKTGWSTATFTNAGDTLTLEYATTRGWFVMGSYGTVVAP